MANGAQKILDRDGGLDCIVCSSDALAQGVLAEVQYRQLPVPHQIGILGFADFDFAAHTFPPLSTVQIDRRTTGVRVAEILLQRMQGIVFDEKIIDIGFKIVERGTT